jgi:pyrroline-5-carboxylate reductase
MSKIGFIGAGNMAFAIAKAIYEKKADTHFYVSDPQEVRRQIFSEEFKRLTICSENQETADSSDVIFLAVKPQIMKTVLADINLEGKIVISIAAGIKLSMLEQLLPGAKCVRVMPNTPCLIGEMAGAYSPADSLVDEEILVVNELLSCAGTAIRVEEDKMDAVTGLSGSGPAFAARIIEYFIKAGVAEGLTEEDSAKLAVATFRGTAGLVASMGMDTEGLIEMVTSPNGTTAAGRSVLESSECFNIIKDTVATAAERSRELGRE